MNNGIGGEGNPRARMTWARVRRLREYYQRNKRPKGAPRHHSWVTPAEVAKKLGMAVSGVRDMLEGRTWRER